MLFRWILALWLVMCGMHMPARAQQDSNGYIVSIRHLTADDGLVSDAVQAGLQDRQGFVWLGSRDGLQRYDGEDFQLFTKEQNGLQSNSIAHLACAADGRIWITYAGGAGQTGGLVDILDPATGNVLPFDSAFRAPPPIGQKDIFYCNANLNGDLFIITRASEVWLYRGGHFRKLFSYPKRLMYTIARDACLWLVTWDSRTIRLDTNGTWQEIRYPGSDVALLTVAYASNRALIRNAPNTPGSTSPSFMTVDSDGRLSPAAFNPYRGFRVGSDYNDLFQRSRYDIRGYGMCYQNRFTGLMLLPGEGQDPIQLLDSAAMAAVGNAGLNAYFTDASGRHWLCTEQGIYLVKVWKNAFQRRLDKTEIRSRTPLATQVRGIYRRPDGTTLAAVYEGIHEFSDSSRTARRLFRETNPVVLYPDGLHLWTTTDDSLLDLNSDVRVSVKAATGGVPDQIRTLYRTTGGRFYAGGTSGIYNISAMPWWRLDTLAGGNGTCFQLFESRDGMLWAATSAGLLTISGNRISARYAANADAIHRLPCTNITYVHEDAAGDFWLCTQGDGLVHWGRATGAIRRYTVADGLSSNVLYALLPDDQGYFWISSARGLMRFQPATGLVRTYTTRDGLTSNAFNRGSYYRAGNGMLYFGSSNGLVAFRPGDLNNAPEASYQPPLRVTGLFLQDKSGSQPLAQSTATLGTAGITFRPGEDGYFTLHFRLLDFEVRRHLYAYHIEGLEDQWNAISESSLRLGNLPYGDYVLRLRGQNARGEWSPTELAIPLHVLRPFYRKAWFLILTGLALLGIGAFAVHRRTTVLRRKNEQLEDTVQKRTGQLAGALREKDVLMKEIHHRVKNNLQVISALLHLQSVRTADSTVQAALETSQNRVLSIAFIHHNLYMHDDLKGVQMKSLIQELTAHITNVFDPERRVTVRQDVDDVPLDIDTAVPVGLIINELLSNSYKYAFRDRAAGAVHIELRETAADEYALSYSDDGPGLPPGVEPGTGKTLGLLLIQQLCDQLDAACDISGRGAFRMRMQFKNQKGRNSQP